MKDMELRFAGNVPSNYDRLMVPVIFRPYAEELARRAQEFVPNKVLETAAGTGAVTEALAEALPGARIVATDLNQPMLDVAAQRVRAGSVEFVAADAQDLPFDDGTFDLVVCQFGAMFFPDRVRGHAEAHRVLRDGGHYLLAIWDRIELNPVSNASQEALIELFPDNPPLFLREGPFSYADAAEIERDLRAAGFADIQVDTVEKRSRASSAHAGAEALCFGTPMGVEVEDRAPGSLDRTFAIVERKLRTMEGPGGLDAPMSAHIVTATK
jgi:ubiquinone/menaquinone biosynthesis C-methylase UbiE